MAAYQHVSHVNLRAKLTWWHPQVWPLGTATISKTLKSWFWSNLQCDGLRHSCSPPSFLVSKEPPGVVVVVKRPFWRLKRCNCWWGGGRAHQPAFYLLKISQTWLQCPWIQSVDGSMSSLALSHRSGLVLCAQMQYCFLALFYWTPSSLSSLIPSNPGFWHRFPALPKQ